MNPCWWLTIARPFVGVSVAGLVEVLFDFRQFLPMRDRDSFRVKELHRVVAGVVNPTEKVRVVWDRNPGGGNLATADAGLRIGSDSAGICSTRASRRSASEVRGTFAPSADNFSCLSAYCRSGSAGRGRGDVQRGQRILCDDREALGDIAAGRRRGVRLKRATQPRRRSLQRRV